MRKKPAAKRSPFSSLSKKELDRRLKEATMLKQIVATSGAPLDPLTVLNVICSELTAVVGVQHAGFARLSEDGRYLTIVSEFGTGQARNTNDRISLEGNEISIQVMRERKPVSVSDAQNDPRMGAGREVARRFGVVSMLLVPILAGDRVLGTLGLDSYEPREFGADEVEIVMAASSAAAPLLENAQLFEQLRSELAERKRAEWELRQSRALYQELVNSLGGIVWEAEFQKDTLVFTFVSRQVERVLGYPVDRFLGPREESVWPRVLYPIDFEMVSQRLRNLSVALETTEIEYRAFDKEGRMHWFQDRVTAMRESSGGTRLRGLIVDVTEHKRAVRLERDRNLALEMIARGSELEDILTATIEMLSSQLPEVACAIQIAKGENLNTVASHGMPEVVRHFLETSPIGPFGHNAPEGEKSEVENLDLKENLPPEVRRALLVAGFRHGLTLPIRTKEGVLGALSVLGPTPLESDSRAIHATADLAAIAVDRQALIEELEYQATHDVLTKLPNRMLYQERLIQAMARAQEKDRLVGVIYIDLNDFKQVNDTFSHATGDELLRSIARQLSLSVRATDSVARLGGDEFGVILADLPSVEMAERLTEKIAHEVNTSVRIGNRALEVTASIGLAIYPRDGSDPDTLYRHADHEMYKAKGHDAGKGSG
ncbi:diguanylate cyclase [uncultured Meiothermus sp.]|uniref:diguanylate cyclase domain-containing protein n=1 Tax=uncultured Meiothermus sp. TaxID=157471 RepID=UPI00260CC40D|nr:diguanylate cyclase [uncultured Meiothermus sp.]